MAIAPRLRVFILAVVAALGLAAPASAAIQVLSPWDVARYRAAFSAVQRADFIDAQLQAAELQDRSLAGHLAFQKLMHPSHRSSYDDLAKWLDAFADHPGADRIHALAMKRRPDGAPAPRQPVLSGAGWDRIETAARGASGPARGDSSRAAREAFYSGEVERAFKLADAAGERWIAGMAAYRLKDYAGAERRLSLVARDETEDEWLRAAAAFWAARAAEAGGDTATSEGHLRLAARFNRTFYGMIAERRVDQILAERPRQLSSLDAGSGFIRAASSGMTMDLARFAKSNPRAHRAVALSQLGLVTDAGLELRAGLSLARSPQERQAWTSLILALNAPITSAEDAPSRLSLARSALPDPDYPTPILEPQWGFTVDKALVYAIVRQESRFNPLAVSPVGAVGLMQLMPAAAARAAGDDKLLADNSPLFDPAYNLRVGQAYLTWLMERGVGYDILHTVAAYNAGPGTLQKTRERVGEDADSLLLIECLPSVETRNYVEKVMAAYWTYRRQFGMDSKILDALASGARSADVRLDADGG